MENGSSGAIIRYLVKWVDKLMQQMFHVLEPACLPTPKKQMWVNGSSEDSSGLKLYWPGDGISVLDLQPPAQFCKHLNSGIEFLSA